MRMRQFVQKPGMVTSLSPDRSRTNWNQLAWLVASTICCTSPIGASDVCGADYASAAAASAGCARTGGSATRGTPWNRRVQLEPRQVHLQPRGDEIQHRLIVDLESGHAGEYRRREVAVVAEDVDILAVVGCAEDRLNALRAQRIDLAARKARR